MRAAHSRQSLLLLAVLAAVGCGRARLALTPAPALAALDSTRIDATIFLIGDAGGPAGVADRVLAELIHQGRSARRASAVVFLGDNVYPRGIPPADHPEAAEARRRLLAQASVADSTGLPVYFVPGNHDWDKQGRDGWAAVQRAGVILEEQAETGARVRLLPAYGCPGPEVVDVGGVARVVMLDTQWWLHQYDRPGRSTDAARRSLPVPDARCTPDSEAGVIDSLARVFAGPGPPVTVLAAHHPFVSHAEHGGWHPIVQYLLPLAPTPIASWLWLPVGWIYPLGRRLVSNRQDQTNGVHRAMRAAIEGTFRPGQPLIYAAGHDHILEVIRQGAGRYYLVSGSGMENHQGAAGAGDSTAFSSARPGFMRVDVAAGGDSVRLGVTIVDESSVAREVYQAWLRP